MQRIRQESEVLRAELEASKRQNIMYEGSLRRTEHEKQELEHELAISASLVDSEKSKLGKLEEEF